MAADAAQLARLLGPPLEAAAAGARQWWLAADGALEYVPFAALPAGQSAAPLAMSDQIAELPSASVLAEVAPPDGRPSAGPGGSGGVCRSGVSRR